MSEGHQKAMSAQYYEGLHSSRPFILLFLKGTIEKFDTIHHAQWGKNHFPWELKRVFMN